VPQIRRSGDARDEERIMLKVADIMTRDVFTLELGTSIEEAAWAFTRRKIGGAPVRDEKGRVIGFLSRADLVNPSWTDWVSPKHATVEDVMNPTVLAVPPEAPAHQAAEGMVALGIHHVMVVDGRSQLVGLVSSLDIVRALAGTLQAEDASRNLETPELDDPRP
jgi:CBS-domain-containing membrane protein